MNSKLFGVLLIAVLATSCATVGDGGGTVQVNYENPDEFTDMTRTFSGDRGADAGYLEELRQHVERVGTNRIPAGHTLTLTITDVDMAGDFEPQRGPNLTDVRIMKSVYPPRISVSYRLTDAAGAVVSEGQRRLTDLSFEWRVTPIERNDPLRYEKALLEDFLGEIGREARAAG